MRKSNVRRDIEIKDVDLREKYLTEEQAAAMIGLSRSALQKYRQAGTGIPYVKMGKIVRYIESDIHRYMRECRVDVERRA